MTRDEADTVLLKYYQKSSLTKDEEFELIETLKYLTENELFDDYNYTFAEWLGGIYYDKRMFDLALKYYELAESQGSRWAWSGLGYIWYYGRTGKVDYEKAYYYFNKAVEYDDDDIEDVKIEAKFKIADMYKNGYYVKKNYEKYKEIIEDLYAENNSREANNRYYIAEIYTRLASIRVKEGRTDEAIGLYLDAKQDLINRLGNNRFFGYLNRMNWLVNDLYKLIEFDSTEMDLYDLYYVLKQEHLVTFDYFGKTYEIESKMSDDGEMNIRFNDIWYRTINDFFIKTDLGNQSIEHEYSFLEDWRIIK